jgi:hypothetical protein
VTRRPLDNNNAAVERVNDAESNERRRSPSGVHSPHTKVEDGIVRLVMSR